MSKIGDSVAKIKQMQEASNTLITPHKIVSVHSPSKTEKSIPTGNIAEFYIAAGYPMGFFLENDDETWSFGIEFRNSEVNDVLLIPLSLYDFWAQRVKRQSISKLNLNDEEFQLLQVAREKKLLYESDTMEGLLSNISHLTMMRQGIGSFRNETTCIGLGVNEVPVNDKEFVVWRLASGEYPIEYAFPYYCKMMRHSNPDITMETLETDFFMGMTKLVGNNLLMLR